MKSKETLKALDLALGLVSGKVTECYESGNTEDLRTYLKVEELLMLLVIEEKERLELSENGDKPNGIE